MACGSLVPRRGIELASSALESRFLTTGPPGKSIVYTFKWNITQPFKNLPIANNINGSRGYYAKWNKSEKTMHDLTYMWDLKNKPKIDS